jgi:hypothetical protein
LTLHATILAAAVTGYYKYSDRSGHFEKSLKGVTDTIEALKRQIASALADHLEPVFKESQSVTSLLIDSSGKQFSETFVNPVGGERYRNAVFSFVQDESQAIADYRRIVEGRDKWLSWARVMCWTFLAALISEALIFAYLFLALKLSILPADVRIALATLAPTGVSFLCFVTAAVRLSLLHDRFVELRKRYASP